MTEIAIRTFTELRLRPIRPSEAIDFCIGQGLDGTWDVRAGTVAYIRATVKSSFTSSLRSNCQLLPSADGAYLVTPKAYVGPIVVGQFGTSIVCRFGASCGVLYRPLNCLLPRS